MSSRVNIINAHLDPKSEQAMAPTPVLLPGNPMDRGAWQATVHGIARVGDDLATKPPPSHAYLGRLAPL